MALVLIGEGCCGINKSLKIPQCHSKPAYNWRFRCRRANKNINKNKKLKQNKRRRTSYNHLLSRYILDQCVVE